MELVKVESWFGGPTHHVRVRTDGRTGGTDGRLAALEGGMGRRRRQHKCVRWWRAPPPAQAHVRRHGGCTKQTHAPHPSPPEGAGGGATIPDGGSGGGGGGDGGGCGRGDGGDGARVPVGRRWRSRTATPTVHVGQLPVLVLADFGKKNTSPVVARELGRGGAHKCPRCW